MKSDLGFLIEIHTEDGFIESEIRFRIFSWVHTSESKPSAQKAAH